MKRVLWGFMLLVTIFGFSSCQTAKPKQPQQDDISAMTTMTQGLTNQAITQDQLKHLGAQMQHDPQARSAVRSINTALSPEHTVKYCPEDGTRYSPDQTWCPDGKVKLEWVD